MSKSSKNEKWGVGGHFQENQQPRGRAWSLVGVADERSMKGKRLDETGVPGWGQVSRTA